MISWEMAGVCRSARALGVEAMTNNSNLTTEKEELMEPVPPLSAQVGRSRMRRNI